MLCYYARFEPTFVLINFLVHTLQYLFPYFLISLLLPVFFFCLFKAIFL